jgi:uncharacterized protein (TIGR02246 family)
MYVGPLIIDWQPASARQVRFRRYAMTAQTPEQVYQLFVQALNAGDIERLMELYEPDAVLVVQPGQTVAGHEQVREALQGYIALKGTITMDRPGIVQGADLALLASRWMLEGTGQDGQPVTISGVTADVVRRGSDGAWRLALDNPGGVNSMQID